MGSDEAACVRRKEAAASQAKLPMMAPAAASRLNYEAVKINFLAFYFCPHSDSFVENATRRKIVFVRLLKGSD